MAYKNAYEEAIFAAAMKAIRAVGIERIKTEEFFGMKQRKESKPEALAA